MTKCYVSAMNSGYIEIEFRAAKDLNVHVIQPSHFTGENEALSVTRIAQICTARKLQRLE